MVVSDAPPFSLHPSCWLSLEGGLLYAFVGPAAVIVLVCAPLASWEGCGRRGSTFSLHSSSWGSFPARGNMGVSLPGGHLVILSPPLTGPPGEYAHWDNRLQQAHGT